MNAERQDGWEELTFGEDTQESRARLGELMLYIAERAERSKDNLKLGAVKLNKLLFYIDFISFAKYGHPLTNTQYQKLPLGPVPTSIESVRAEMQAAKDIALINEELPPYTRRRVIPLRDARLDDYFTASQISLVDEVIQTLHDLNASEVSALSHDFAWHITGDYELIPYDAVFIYDRELAEHEVKRARELAAKYGWDV